MTDAPKPSQVGPTKGPWKVCESIEGDFIGVYPDTGKIEFPIAKMSNFVRAEVSAANARLIAEAGTVYSETGLSPRALLEQRDNAVRAVAALMRNKTCNPLAMTPDERRALWRSHELARAVLSHFQPPQDLDKVEREDDGWLPIETTNLATRNFLMAVDRGEGTQRLVGEVEQDDDGHFWWAGERGSYHADHLLAHGFRLLAWRPLPPPPAAARGE